MTIPSQVLREETKRIEFEHRLWLALATARSGQCAIVIVPPGYPKQQVLNALGHMLEQPRDHNARVDSMALWFDGTRGSVRVYPSDHVTWDAKQKRMLDYPPGIAYFLHPKVEGL